MSKANQKFAQADEAVSPVIGVILMVAITVVLAAVVFVLVSNLSKTSDKAEDVAFKADSPVAGQLHITMIKMGVNGPYAINTEDSTTADDVFVTLNGQLCNVDTISTAELAANYGTDHEEFANLTGFTQQSTPASVGGNGFNDTDGSVAADDPAALWGAGEVMIFTTECTGTEDALGETTPARFPLLYSSTEHRVQVTVRGTLVFEGNVVIR